MIEFSDVHFAYHGGPSILRGVSLTLHDGEHVGLVGSNGSGKSTLAKLTNGLLLPTQGKVTVDGLDTAVAANLPAIRQRVGMVFQNPDNQIVGSIVEDDVAFGPENLGLATEEIERRVRWALEHTGLSELARRSPMGLSGGQKQRLAVAGVLAMQPSHMVLDEATAMLDPAGRLELLEVARDLKRVHGIAVVQITHLLEELLTADRVVALERGKIAFDGPKADFLEDPKLLSRLGLEAPAILALYQELRKTGLVEKLESLSVETMAAGIVRSPRSSRGASLSPGGARPATDSPPRHSSGAPGKVAIVRVNGISVVYLAGTPFETWALREMELEIGPGELIGVVGATGSGKSTFAQTICGLLDPSSGTIEYGPGIDPASPATSVGLVFQQPEDQIFERTVLEEVAFGPRQLSLPEAEVLARVKDALEAVGLPPGTTLERSPFEMSGGEKRRVAIASLLAMRPRVLIFDEPTAGLDAAGRRQLLGHIRRLQSEQGRTVIVISHDMEMLAQLARTLLVMAGGRAVRMDAPAAIYSEPQLMIGAGLRPPVWVELLQELRTRGLDVQTGLLSVSEAVAEIRRGTKSAARDPQASVS